MIAKVLTIIKNETLPALGCTEPVAVSYAASDANKYLKEEIQILEIRTSKNIFKNGKFVTIPNTKEWGLDLAAVLGIIGGNTEDELMVLRNINSQDIKKAHKILDKGKVYVNY